MLTEGLARATRPYCSSDAPSTTRSLCRGSSVSQQAVANICDGLSHSTRLLLVINGAFTLHFQLSWRPDCVWKDGHCLCQGRKEKHFTMVKGLDLLFSSQEQSAPNESSLFSHSLLHLQHPTLVKTKPSARQNRDQHRQSWLFHSTCCCFVSLSLMCWVVCVHLCMCLYPCVCLDSSAECFCAFL